MAIVGSFLLCRAGHFKLSLQIDPVRIFKLRNMEKKYLLQVLMSHLAEQSKENFLDSVLGFLRNF